MDHLVCFLPATIAIALHHGVLPRGKGHLKVATRILRTCIGMYSLSPITGLSPEM